jgi:hypothetical protein
MKSNQLADILFYHFIKKTLDCQKKALLVIIFARVNNLASCFLFRKIKLPWSTSARALYFAAAYSTGFPEAFNGHT